MRSALALFIVFLLCPLTMWANSITYTYTGPAFEAVFGPYTTSNSITGSFTLEQPLTSNLTSPTVINPVAFTFSDGVNTINNTSVNAQSSFYVATDDVGSITAFDISLTDGLGYFSYVNQIAFGNTDGAMYSKAVDGLYSYTVPVYTTHYYEYQCGWSTCTGSYTTTSYQTYGETVGSAFATTSGSFSSSLDATTAMPATPEPSALLLLSTGLMAVTIASRKSKLGNSII